MVARIGSVTAAATVVVFALSGGLAWAGAGKAGHSHATQSPEQEADHSAIEQMREIHKGHEHGHDFEAMERMSPAEIDRVMSFMTDIGVALPPMSSDRGRAIFLEKGCVACHSVNGVGGDVGPALDAAEMPKPMNAFEFAARMWRGAGAMITMQEDEQFGGQIDLSGQELADLVAFAHDADAQAWLKADQIPKKFRAMIE